MIDIDLDGRVLGNVRFAIPPMHCAVEVLLSTRRCGPAGRRMLAQRVGESVRGQRLSVLAALIWGPTDGVPDFLCPPPTAYERSVDDDLQRIATTGTEHVRQEMACVLDEARRTGTALPRPLLSALERGEAALAERLAAELGQLWQTAFRPHWASLRARLEADIAYRSQRMAQYGVTHMLSELHPALSVPADHLLIATAGDVRVRQATTLWLVPRAFGTAVIPAVDPSGGPRGRQPVLIYPARRPDDPAGAARTGPAQALVGSSRASLIAALDCPRSTQELARRLSFSQSTVSYHLGILHRAGLITKTRQGRSVMYRRTHRAESLLAAM